MIMAMCIFLMILSFKQQVEDSLKRLQLDYIDLYYIHFPDDDTAKDEAVAALKN